MAKLQKLLIAWGCTTMVARAATPVRQQQWSGQVATDGSVEIIDGTANQAPEQAAGLVRKRMQVDADGNAKPSVDNEDTVSCGKCADDFAAAGGCEATVGDEKSYMPSGCDACKKAFQDKCGIEDVEDEVDDNPLESDEVRSTSADLVRQKMEKLMEKGCGGTISWDQKVAGETECKLKGTLAYQGMKLKFDLDSSGSEFKKEGTDVMFGVKKVGDGSSVAMTIEGAVFVAKETMPSGGYTPSSMLYVGRHQDVFHNTTEASISHSLLTVSAHEREQSAEMYRKKADELFNDKYDNAILELMTCSAVDGISARTHPCFLHLYDVYAELKKKSKVIDEATAKDAADAEISDAELSDADVATASLAERGNSERGNSSWIGWITGQFGNRRCPYNHCGNGHFGRCGDGAGVGCVWAVCANCDCNRACENHDDWCHCHGRLGEQVCTPTLAYVAGSSAWGGGCVECSSRADCRRRRRRRRFWRS